MPATEDISCTEKGCSARRHGSVPPYAMTDTEIGCCTEIGYAATSTTVRVLKAGMLLQVKMGGTTYLTLTLTSAFQVHCGEKQGGKRNEIKSWCLMPVRICMCDITGTARACPGPVLIRGRMPVPVLRVRLRSSLFGWPSLWYPLALCPMPYALYPVPLALCDVRTHALCKAQY
eukprot:1956212-Rhodomonas_salina.2